MTVKKKKNTGYHGPSARQVGHRKHDELLIQVIQAVSDNMSREDLLAFFLDKFAPISGARAIIVLNVSEVEENNGTISQKVEGFDQRGIHPNRWRRFKQSCNDYIPPGSLVHQVIVEGLEMEIWGSMYFPDDFKIFRPLFDVEKGGWISGIQLPRATARHPHQALFLWYPTGKHSEKLPAGSEHDLRFLKLFRRCYGMAGYNIRNVARSIIMQRQELLMTLTPSILNHEINARILFFKKGLEYTREELESCINECGISVPIQFQENMNKVSEGLQSNCFLMLSV